MSGKNRWARIPRRVGVDAIEDGTLTFRQVGLLNYLICKADPPSSPQARSYSFKLRDLAAAVRWPKGEEQLRRELHVLAEVGEIDLQGGQGKRYWTVRIAKDDLWVEPRKQRPAAAEQTGVFALPKLREMEG